MSPDKAGRSAVRERDRHKIMLVVGPTRSGKGVIALWPGSSVQPVPTETA